MAGFSISAGSAQNLLDQLRTVLLSLEGRESQSLAHDHQDLDHDGATRSATPMTSSLQNSKNSTRASVPLSHARRAFLVDRPSAQRIVKDKFKEKGLDCEFDFERGEMHAEADSSVSPEHVTRELEKIIVEHDLDMSPEYLAVLAHDNDRDVLSSWKMSSVNEAVVVKNRKGTLSLVGFAGSVDFLNEDLVKSKDRLGTKAGKKTPKGKDKEYPTEIIPLNEYCFEYLSRYKDKAIDSIVSKEPNITARLTLCPGKTPQGIAITGPPADISRVKSRLNDLVKQVQTTRFLCDGGTIVACSDMVVHGIAGRNNCIVKIGHPSSRDLSLMTDVFKLETNAHQTSVAVVINELQLQEADVIVNTIHKNLTMGVGRVSTTLLKACGSGVQEELRRKYPGGIEYGHVAVTASGQLTTCKDIYHGALPFWKGIAAVSIEKCYEALLLLVYRCLVNASGTGYKSIAFPALGTGALEYPYENVALLMYRAVRMFLQNYPKTSLENIYFVVYPWANREFKQVFFANSISQTTNTTQTIADNIQEKIGKSRKEIFEVLFRVGKTTVKVVNADVNDACHSSSPIVVLWRPEEIEYPVRKKGLSSLCGSEDVCQIFISKVKNLQRQKTVLDTTSVPSRTLIHCYCPSDRDKDVTTAVQTSLERACKEKLDTVSLPIPTGDGLTDTSTCKALLMAVKKCSSSVYVVAFFVPDGRVFSSFVTTASKSYKCESPPSANTTDTTDLIASTWRTSYSEISQAQVTAALRMLPIEDNIMLTVTSDSTEKNRTVAVEIQKALQK